MPLRCETIEKHTRPSPPITASTSTPTAGCDRIHGTHRTPNRLPSVRSMARLSRDRRGPKFGGLALVETEELSDAKAAAILVEFDVKVEGVPLPSRY